MEIETREEFEKILICKMCGRPLTYTFKKWDERKDFIELKVSCGLHDGRRRISTQSFKHLLATGALFGDGVEREPEKFFEYITIIQSSRWMENLFLILFGVMTVPFVITLLFGLYPLTILLSVNDLVLICFGINYHGKSKYALQKAQKFLVEP